MTHVLAIDQGTSGTKAVVVSDDAVLGLGEVPVRPAYLDGGAVEQDPGALLDSVLVAGRAGGRRGGRADRRRRRWPTRASRCWRGTRAPATRSPRSSCGRTVARRRCATTSREHAELVAARTGLVLDPYFSRAEAGVGTTPPHARRRGHDHRRVAAAPPHRRARHRRVDGQPLAGDRPRRRASGTTSCSSCSASPTSACRGSSPTTRSRATTSAFGGDVPVGGLVVDQQAALLAQRCLAPGEAKCTFGTGAFLLANVGAAAAAVALRTHHVGRLAGRAATTAYCVDGQVFTAASAVRWLQDLGLVASAAELDAVAADDAGGVLAVPAFAGLGAPWWRAGRDGVVHRHDAVDGPRRARARGAAGDRGAGRRAGALVGADTGTPLARLRVDGGLTRSRVLMQAVADLMQVEVDVYPSPHATAARRGGAGAHRARPRARAGRRRRRRGSPTRSTSPRGRPTARATSARAGRARSGGALRWST